MRRNRSLRYLPCEGMARPATCHKQNKQAESMKHWRPKSKKRGKRKKVFRLCAPTFRIRFYFWLSLYRFIINKKICFFNYYSNCFANFSSINLVYIFRCSSPPLNPVYTRRVIFRNVTHTTTWGEEEGVQNLKRKTTKHDHRSSHH
jgi:hypothetical protein